MKATRPAPAVEKKEKETPHLRPRLFEKSNYLWMLGGAAVMILGFILMAGGRSDNPNEFHYDEVYSTTRITIAPILILIGLVIEVFALFRNPKA